MAQTDFLRGHHILRSLCKESIMPESGIAHTPPKILAPAGSRDAFLAALAAGADAVYCGLKSFSARMEADNFAMEELAGLTQLAHQKGAEVYVTMNTLLKEHELERALSQIQKLAKVVRPDAIIFADPAIPALARAAGFKGELHLSTLSNVSFTQGFEEAVATTGAKRIVLPREYNIEEIRAAAQAAPEGVDLEVFIHGALCYGVSGRCYWSSYMGGKSGLRGRCVQPCRRLYRQGHKNERFFSCQDLSLDTLVKVLLDIPEVTTWKIEGRKKGPHYVYYATMAYKMLRDEGKDPQAKKTALGLLEMALGRPGTHYNFLPHRPYNPVDTKTQTGSGLMIARLQGSFKAPWITPREGLLPGDLLRIGYEDEKGHLIRRVKGSVPKKGKFHIQTGKERIPEKGSPVFLIDRREEGLRKAIAALDKEARAFEVQEVAPSSAKLPFAKRHKAGKKTRSTTLYLFREDRHGPKNTEKATWVSEKSVPKTRKGGVGNRWWWLDPAIWPSQEKEYGALVRRLVNFGAKHFVLGAPWQIAFFPEEKRKGLSIWAGPFCNIANSLAIQALKERGVTGALASPELSSEDFRDLAKASPLPTGVVVAGYYPLTIARTLTPSLNPHEAFASPKGEESWVSKYGENHWLYPNWRVDITSKASELKSWGYSLFVHMHEPIPKGVKLKKRPGEWNWNIRLL